MQVVLCQRRLRKISRSAKEGGSMRSFLIRAVGLPAAAVLLAAAGAGLPGDAPKDDVQAELKKVQGLWQHVPGGMQHQDGAQVVRGPARDGPRDRKSTRLNS